MFFIFDTFDANEQYACQPGETSIYAVLGEIRLFVIANYVSYQTIMYVITWDSLTPKCL